MTTLSPSVPALRQAFSDAVERVAVSCGDTIVYVHRDRVHDAHLLELAHQRDVWVDVRISAAHLENSPRHGRHH